MKTYYSLLFIVFLFFAKANAQNYNNIVNYSLNNTPANGIEILTALPFTSNSQMPTIIIQGFNLNGLNYGGTGPISLTLTYYITGTPAAFDNYSVSSSGAYAPPISLSNEGGYVAIFINDKPYYPRFTVSAYAHGFSADTSLNYPPHAIWQVLDAAPGGTSLVNVPYKNTFGNNVNIMGGPTSGNFVNISNTGTYASTMKVGTVTSNNKQESQIQYQNAFGIVDANAPATPRLYILPTGYTGIGTSTPGSLLDIGSPSLRGTVGIIGSTTQAPIMTLVDSQPGGRGYSIYSGLSSAGNFDILDQSTSNSNYKITINSLGYVGLGTPTPFSPLDISGNVTGNIAGSNVSGNLTLENTYNVIDSGASIQFTSSGRAHPGPRIKSALQLSDGTENVNNLVLSSYWNGYQNEMILSQGTVYIGTPIVTSLTYKLNVNGFVRANEVVVNTTGADFVFDPKYKLYALSDLKKYIDRNHHLPEIASAQQMQAEGIKVGENETKLLQKVEELTLYLIEEDKKEKKQEEINEVLKGQINLLKLQTETLIRKVSKNPIKN